jgi:hypothetical protein
VNVAPWTSGAPSARPAVPCPGRRSRALRRLAVALALAARAGGALAGEAAPSPALALAAPAVARTFEEALDRFVPVLPATTARYFGFTDLGPRPGDAISAPSEVERYAVVTAPSPGLGAVLGQRAPPARAATATPHPLLRLTGGGVPSRAWSAPGSAFAATGWQATAGAPSGPWRGRLVVTVGEEVRGTTSSPAPSSQPSSRVGSQSTGALQLRLAEPVMLQVEGHRISERGAPGDGVVVDGARTGLAIAVLPRVLELSAGAGVDRVQADADPVATGRTSATAGLTAHLGPALTVSGAAAVQTGALSPAAASNALFGQLPASRMTTAAVAWRQSARLQLSAALSRVGTPSGAGTARQLRASWAPRAGGRLRLAAAYEESVDPATGLRASQAVLQPSLRLGRFASLEASLAEAVRSVAGPVAHPLAVLVSFTIRS